MKKFTLLFASLLCVAYIAVAQLKLYVYQNDGTRTEFVTSTVDSIAFSTITDSPDQPDDPIKPVDPTNGYEYVDLGLPSGTKWATMNVGANSPEEYGDYFAWGETEPKSYYDWSTYKWCNGSYDTQTKYCTSSSYGTVDNKITLDLSDDAAYVNWGSSWRMPTKAEYEELINTSYTTWTWTTKNGVKGYKVTSKTNGNSIFLPAAGCRDNSDLYNAGFGGGYWSSSLSTGNSYDACNLDFYSDEVDSYYGNREYGQSIRPVLRDVEFTFTIMFDGNGGEGIMPAIDGQHDDRVKIPASTFTRDGYYFVGWNAKADGTGTSYKVDGVITLSEDLTLYAQWKLSSGTSNGYTWIDLDLPSGTKWATCNVGADSPEEYGDYFAWGETESKSKYNWSTYKWCEESNDTMTKYCTSSSYGTVDNKITLDLSDDAAYVNWGSSWRMPTDAEFKELKDNCTWSWTTHNGVSGYKVTSKVNGNIIFLPAAGYRYLSDLKYAGTYGYYWSSSLYTNDSSYAYYLYLDSDNVRSYRSFRDDGRSVRPVFRDVEFTFTIMFDGNGGAGTMSAMSYEKGETKVLTANKFTRTGYIFKGWNTKSDGTGTPYTDKQSITPTENLTLYAQWENGYTFTVMFDGNGGAGTMSAMSYEKGETKVLTANKFTRTGYIFKGWNTKSDGTGTPYTDKQSITPTENLTLYAQWKPLSGTSNGYNWIDLGLPSGTKWATCNVGADSPEDYGDYFAWGETEPKDTYNWWRYKWMTEGMFDWDGVNKYTIADGRTTAVWYNNYGNFIGDNKTTLDLSDDAAYTNWGTSWRMPTYAEFKELIANCTWIRTTQNGVEGYKVTSKTNGNSIFLPATGSAMSSSYGDYWSSSLNTNDSSSAYCLYFLSDDVDSSDSSRYDGKCVRPVLAK